LAKRYEEAAKEMQLKVEEHKKLLSQYESKSHFYGRHEQSFKDHCQTLINAYEKAAEAGLSMANMHRRMQCFTQARGWECYHPFRLFSFHC
jgi:hypothetical protein